MHRYPLDAINSWMFATTQEITVTYDCGDERGKVQDCIARSSIIALQRHPAIRSMIEKKLPTIVTHPIKIPRQVSHQSTTTHNKTADKLNQMQGEVHQLQEQQERGDLETTSKTQRNYIKM